jgi:hypothetical protein
MLKKPRGDFARARNARRVDVIIFVFDEVAAIEENVSLTF